MISIKTPNDIEILEVTGKISKEVMDLALKAALPGTATIEIDELIDSEIKKRGAYPWFKDVDNYEFASCISVNDTWLHGVPSTYKLKEFDVVKIDLGIKYQGLHTDNCWTIVVHQSYGKFDDIRDVLDHNNPKITTFLNTAKNVFCNAVEQAKVSFRTGDISHVMQNGMESKGYSVIEGFVGHGIGYDHWEEPQIPCRGVKGAGALLEPGMVLAIELMTSMGNHKHYVVDNGFDIKTLDNSITAMFEHTVVVTNEGPKILTL